LQPTERRDGMTGHNVYTLPRKELAEWLLKYMGYLIEKVRVIRPDHEDALAELTRRLDEVGSVDAILARMQTSDEGSFDVAAQLLRGPTDEHGSVPELSDTLGDSLYRGTSALAAHIQISIRTTGNIKNPLGILLGQIERRLQDLWLLGARAAMEAEALEQGVAPSAFLLTGTGPMPKTILEGVAYGDLITPSPDQIAAQAQAAEDWVVSVVDVPVLAFALAD